MKLVAAEATAKELVEKLGPTCERCEIGGGIRRRKADVHDIEIICVPKRTDEFGYTTITEKKIWQMYMDGEMLPGDKSKNGAKAPMGPDYYRMKYKGQKVDIFFVVPPAQWGVEFLLRTGSKEFNIWIVQQGYPKGITFRDAHLVKNSMSPGSFGTALVTIHTPEEEDVFRELGLKWISPEDRRVEKGDNGAEKQVWMNTIK